MEVFSIYHLQKRNNWIAIYNIHCIISDGYWNCQFHYYFVFIIGYFKYRLFMIILVWKLLTPIQKLLTSIQKLSYLGN